MKFRFFILTLLVLFLSNTENSAQIFWKISGNGLSKPSYLLGTHHLIEKEQIPAFQQIQSYISQTDVVIGEMDLSKMFNLQLKLVQSSIMKDSTINQLLSAEDYQLVDNRFKEVMGKGLDQLGRIKPAMLSVMYEVMFYMKENNLKKEPEAIDEVVQNTGRKNKKKIIGLETIDQQIDILLNSSSLKHQAEMLTEGVKNKEKSLKMMQELNNAYLTFDLNKMVILSYEDDSTSKTEREVLIYNRNQNWITQLMKIIPQNSCFIAVGCLHLPEKKGLIQLFKDAGFTVEPVEL